MGPSADTSLYSLTWKAENRENYYPPRLYRPYGISVVNSSIVVAEGFWPYSRIQLFDLTSGRSLRTSEQGTILPYDIALTSENVVAVTDHRHRTVKFMSLDDCLVIESWQDALFEWPTGIAAESTGKFYVVDSSVGVVHLLDAEGTTISSFTSAVSSSTSHPFAVAVDSHRRVVVSDTRDHSVNIFDPDGCLLSRASDSCQITDPRGVCVDNRDNIIVADWGADAIRQFNSDGMWIADVVGKDDGISHPWGVAVNDSCILAITEQKLSDKPAVKVFMCQ